MSKTFHAPGLPTLAELHGAGVPVYRLRSRELDTLHLKARDFYWRYREEFDGFQYVVDHGGFNTLNTLYAGQLVPVMLDIP